MQNPVNTGAGIIPPPVHSQPLRMQSTTPSVANGKDEMRGWLYKWTNVTNLEILVHQSNKFSSSSLVSKRLSKTLVCFTNWNTFVLSFPR